MMDDSTTPLEKLLQVMKTLRGPHGCPWDKKQDLSSLGSGLLEECHEVLAEMETAAHSNDWSGLQTELGDLLLQIVFQSQLASEKNFFDFHEVCSSLTQKLIRQHPHVFQNPQAPPPEIETVLRHWEKLKTQTNQTSLLDGIPQTAPQLLQAERIGAKTSHVGFDFDSYNTVRAKLDEELAELDKAVASKEKQNIFHELGDVLFSLANLARWQGICAENALRSANQRFVERFRFMETLFEKQGKNVADATNEALDNAWQKAKKVLSETALDSKPLSK
ncbi:MAG: nucleoside triphosphate pyrophosphohydrolase [Cystobacterineae bacterium]|nr:nucleoside triphosphate pyrophosphohydrolase [Cystobacterineae bacterium]